MAALRRAASTAGTVAPQRLLTCRVGDWLADGELAPADWPYGTGAWRSVEAFQRFLAARRSWVAEHAVTLPRAAAPRGVGDGATA